MFEFRAISTSVLAFSATLLLSRSACAEWSYGCIDVPECKNAWLRAKEKYKNRDYRGALLEYRKADEAYSRGQAERHDPDVMQRLADVLVDIGDCEAARTLAAQIVSQPNILPVDREEAEATLDKCRLTAPTSMVTTTGPSSTAIAPSGRQVPPRSRASPAVATMPPIVINNHVEVRSAEPKTPQNQSEMTPVGTNSPNPPPVPSSTDKNDRSPLYKKFWLWTLVGAGATAIIVAVSVAATRPHNVIYEW